VLLRGARGPPLSAAAALAKFCVPIDALFDFDCLRLIEDKASSLFVTMMHHLSMQLRRRRPLLSSSSSPRLSGRERRAAIAGRCALVPPLSLSLFHAHARAHTHIEQQRTSSLS